MFEEKKPEPVKPAEPLASGIKDEESAKGPMIAIPKEFIRKRKKFPRILIWLIILVVLIGFIFLLSYLSILRLEQKGKFFLNQPITTPEIPITPPPPTLDSDGDGLTDEEEQTLGTNINSPDSDQDGLFDKEEVKIYQTDPLNPDTDGDGYQDGEEVKAGYHPKDPSPQAKLFDLKTEIEKLE